MNSIRMMNWSGLSKFLIRSLSIFALLLSVSFNSLKAQNIGNNSLRLESLLQPSLQINYSNTFADTVDYFPNYPDPTSVMFKSMILPGWGQVINDQIWKVPIIYALLGGLTYYSIYLTKKYHDYRAAYYNLNDQLPDDERFGPTPPYISVNTSLSFLRSTRNNLRNRRDFIYVTIALAYGLNIIDAYVFAHLKPFDVSEDLSMNASLKPALVAPSSPGVTLSFELY